VRVSRSALLLSDLNSPDSGFTTPGGCNATRMTAVAFAFAPVFAFAFLSVIRGAAEDLLLHAVSQRAEKPSNL
jgi:hypothetical protein